MNQKKIKALRKSLRAQGVDVNDRKYQEIGGIPSSEGFCGITGTIKLVRGCGRQLYKAMKA